MKYLIALYVVLFSSLLIGMVFSLYMMWRNGAVFQYRMNVVKTDPSLYEKLPDYNTMMKKWWILPISKFEKQNAKPKLSVVK